MSSVIDQAYHRKELLRGILAVCLIIVGITHFLRPEQYARIVPPIFPPFASVYLSGVLEILGGIGLMIPAVSVAAAWGLISLFIAVFPANIYMTLHNIPIDSIPQNQLLYIARLPFQAVLIAWAYWYTRRTEEFGVDDRQ
ncbi:DoxX family protein [Nostoc sp. MS1]|uniref:DoxX family protein n=1 Tax=Nostoc sp. MS1 TaxID=2764711 RepID=UPI001CC7079A|nr:DoxX family protein [Nostoc sp. MS1]BCL33642.1 membrane protein [Nostoc sp. MS1]